jgi:AraC-like DNA-binding protein
LEKVTGIIESRMIDSDFSVDVLAQEIGISRTGLFTKLKAVSGMTPNDFIRIIRLKKAAVLLSQDGVQVSEACWHSSGLLLRNSSV